MSEEKEGPESGSDGTGAGIDPVATALALGGASREKADAFLDDQRVLIDEQTKLTRLQAQELSHELGLRHWSLWVRHASGLLKLGLELSAGLLLLAVVGCMSLMVWNAAHSEGLVVESFSVPPDMAAKGLTGQVIAGQTIDRLTAIIASTDRSIRAAKSYSSNWGDDIKVEIPDTGMSVGEAYRFLRGWLGHETHISGEITRTSTGIVLTTRLSGQPGNTVSGAESDLDGLLQKMAEKIAAQTQPYRYGVYLRYFGRRAEGIAVLKELATTGPAEERAWGYIGWSAGVGESDGTAALALVQKAADLAPDNPLALGNLGAVRHGRGEYQLSLRLREKALAALDGPGKELVNPKRLALYIRSLHSEVHSLQGAYGEAAREQADIIAEGANLQIDPFLNVAVTQTHAHDLGAGRAALGNPLGATFSLVGANALAGINARMAIAMEARDWKGALSLAKTIPPLLTQYPGLRPAFLTNQVPDIAYVQARLGDFAAAERAIAPTPATCYPCLVVRARIAALRGQRTRAEWWFARAVAEGPSIPIAYYEWGRALLARGEPDEAIAQFKLANQKGPHFADPLEGWGEALMAKNQSHLALAKFEEAEKYAPNWGRLHLKWAQALLYTGSPADAKKHFAHAATLDLTPSEKSELAKMRAHV